MLTTPPTDDRILRGLCPPSKERHRGKTVLDDEIPVVRRDLAVGDSRANDADGEKKWRQARLTLT